MRNTKMRIRRRLNEGMSWEDKYEEVLKLLKKKGWNDVIKQLEKELDDSWEDYDDGEDAYCGVLSSLDDYDLKSISEIINK